MINIRPFSPVGLMQDKGHGSDICIDVQAQDHREEKKRNEKQRMGKIPDDVFGREIAVSGHPHGHPGKTCIDRYDQDYGDELEYAFKLQEREDMPLSQCNNVTFRNNQVEASKWFDVQTSDKYKLIDFVEDGKPLSF